MTTPGDPDAPESSAQLIASLAIVGGLVVIGIGCLVVGYVTKNWAAASPLLGTIIGALATALNAPSGIGKVLAAARKSNDPQPLSETVK